jgi:hypothetical protein
MLIPDHEDEYNHDKPSVIIDMINREMVVTREETSTKTPFDKIIVEQVMDRMTK